MDLKWEDGFSISVRTDQGATVITANREGLRSLAAHLLALAREKPGAHIHLDDCNSLEDGSGELIVEIME